MSTRLIIEGNAVYEIDEDCVKKREQQSEEQKAQKKLMKNEENAQITNTISKAFDKNVCS